MMNRKSNKIKIELQQVNNGFILGIVNPNFQPGSTDYYRDTYVGNDLKEMTELLVAQLVTDRFESVAK
jgi:hypothetical protein